MKPFRNTYTNRVYVLSSDSLKQVIEPKISIQSEIIPLAQLGRKKKKLIRKTLGILPFAYLAATYGASETHIALGWSNGELAHVAFVIPSEKSGRNFISNNSYMIGPCLTPTKFRGNKIYPFILQEIVVGIKGRKEFWISANESNIPSLKGIERVGGIYCGRCYHKKWFWGAIKKRCFCPND